MMIVFAEVRNIFTTRARCPAQVSSCSELRLCQEFVRSTIHRASACDGSPFLLITPVTPRFMEQIPGFVRVVAALQVHHDLIGQVKLEPVEFSTIGRSRDDSALAPARADPHA